MIDPFCSEPDTDGTHMLLGSLNKMVAELQTVVTMLRQENSDLRNVLAEALALIGRFSALVPGA